MSLLQAAGVAAGAVQTTQDLLERDPHIRHRGYFQELEHPEMGTCLVHNWPIKLSRTPAQLRQAPILGEHTEYICREILHMSDEEFLDLLTAGVLE